MADTLASCIFQAGALTFIQAWARAPPLALLGSCQLP